MTWMDIVEPSFSLLLSGLSRVFANLVINCGSAFNCELRSFVTKVSENFEQSQDL